MEVRQLFVIARRWIRLLVLGIVAGTVLGYAVGSVLPKTYHSTATLLVGQPFTATTGDLAANQQQAQTYAELATLRPLLEKVIAAVGVQETPEALAGQVLVEVSHTSNLLTIGVSSSKSDTAAAIANAVANQLIALAPAPSSNSAAGILTIVEPAVIVLAPSAPKVPLITALGTVGGLFAAALVIAVVMQGERNVRRLAAGDDASKSFSYQVTVAARPRLELDDAAIEPVRSPSEPLKP